LRDEFLNSLKPHTALLHSDMHPVSGLSIIFRGTNSSFYFIMLLINSPYHIGVKRNMLIY